MFYMQQFRMASQKEQFYEKGQIFRPDAILFDIPDPQLLSQYSVVHWYDHPN